MKLSVNYTYHSLEDYLSSRPLDVDGMLDDGWGAVFPVKGREIDAVIVFVDIGGFSGRTFDLGPTETLIFANNFFSWITAEGLRGRPGIVDKYIGDEMMIVFSQDFGSEDAFKDALLTAVGMTDQDVLSFCPHIGLAEGRVTVGYVGTPLKYNCSVFGRPVSTAARCCSMRSDIDKGMLRNVPYQSFRCGDDYEVNIYGDLDRPAGIEAGVYRKLVADDSAKSNCVKFLAGLLGNSADRETVGRLDMQKDRKSQDGMTFEITPPSADDAYMGWWVSVYSERELNLARASDKELKDISVPKAEVAKQTSRTGDPSAWSAQDLKFARPDTTTITFTTKSGSVISNAQVKPYVEGVSLIWRVEGGRGGIVQLADLPEELRGRFGYDPGKAAAVEASDEAKRAREAQALAAQASVPPPVASSQTSDNQSTPAYPVGGYQASSGGSVYVSGYYRKNGTYVHSYTRRQ